MNWTEVSDLEATRNERVKKKIAERDLWRGPWSLCSLFLPHKTTTLFMQQISRHKIEEYKLQEVKNKDKEN